MAATLGNCPFYFDYIFSLIFADSSLAALAQNPNCWNYGLFWASPERILFERQYITSIHCSNIFGKSCTGPPKYFDWRITPIAWRNSQASPTFKLGKREWLERPGARSLQGRGECSWALTCDLSQFPSRYVQIIYHDIFLICMLYIALIQAIDFYMDEARTKERAEIIRLSNIKSPSADVNKQLMGYIREAQSL